MKGVDADGPAGPEIQVFPGGSPCHGQETADVVEAAPRRRRPWWRRPGAGPVVAALVVGVLVGYLIGVRTATAPAPRTNPVSSGVHASRGDSVLVTPPAQPLAATGNRCSSQDGDKLMLGVEIVNQSTTTVTVLRVAPHFPLGGLRVVTTEWRRCGQVSPVPDTPRSLAPGATSWFMMTFDVLIPCPAPIPVQFTLTYNQANLTGVADLRGFPDLGDVPYTGCTASPG